MTILGTRQPGSGRATRSGRARDVDPRRVGIRAVGRFGLPLAVVARLAEAERMLPPGLHLLLVEVEVEVENGVSRPVVVLHVTLADGAGDPVWMGALPVVTGEAGSGTCLPAARDAEADRRMSALAAAMRAVGFANRTSAWFRWEL